MPPVAPGSLGAVVMAPSPAIDGLRGGRLLGWQEAWPQGWAREVVSEGLQWFWGEAGAPPLRFSRPHRKTSPSILARVDELLRDGVVEKTTGRYHLNRLFEVPKKDSDKSRLVLDVSALNKFIPSFSFRMTTVPMVRQALVPGCFMASVDLKDAYWHVPIHRRFRPFLAFSAGATIYQFRVMPFGLNIAPRVFTRILRPVHKRLAMEGVQVLMYLDDWLIYAESLEECRKMVATTLAVGAAMGIRFNLPKSHLEPTTSLQWLGLTWESTSSSVSLSPVNRQKCRARIYRALEAATMSRREWSCLLGSLNHAASVIPLGRLRTRRLHLLGDPPFLGMDWDVQIPFPLQLKSLLRWWVSDGRLDSCDAWVAPLASMSLTTDASDSGWGYQSSVGHQGSGVWSACEKDLHINVRELMTVTLALSREPSLARTSVHVLSDSVATVFCINKQGTVRSADLLRASGDLLEEAHRRGLVLEASHIAGTSNSWADALSRDSTTSLEWSLSSDCFEGLCRWVGTPQVDLFAAPSNHRLPLFLSEAVKTRAGGPNAFTEDWNRWEFVYLFPPPATQVMLSVFRHLESFRGRVLLIAPHWEAQPWFPALLRRRPLSRLLEGRVLRQECSDPFMTSLRLTAWHF